MWLEHRGKTPSVDPSAYVAPTAVLCGDTRYGSPTTCSFARTLM